MFKRIHILFSVSAIGAMILGCGGGETASKPSTAGPDSTYLAPSEPAGAVGVGEARQQAKDTEEVVVFGRIGGSVEPFVDGIAAFTIVDTKIPSCAGEEGCPTPWDYCCKQNEVKENIATVKVVDAQGNPVEQDARGLLGVKELNTVVVHGTAKRDAAGNLSVAADRVFIRE